MAILTATIISDAVALKEADDGQNGICEWALKQEAVAIRDARAILGTTVADLLGGTDYTAAAADSDEGIVYALYLASVARLAVARIGPQRFSIRVTDAGGAQTEVGEGDRTTRLLSYRDAVEMLGDMREQAGADLRSIAAEIRDADPDDALYPVPVITVI